MSGAGSVAEAKAEALAARARLSGTIDQVRARLTRASLTDDAIEGVKAGSLGLARKARRRPALAGGIAVAAILLLGRKPLLRLGCALFRRREATTADDFGLAQDVTKG